MTYKKNHGEVFIHPAESDGASDVYEVIVKPNYFYQTIESRDLQRANIWNACEEHEVHITDLGESKYQIKEANKAISIGELAFSATEKGIAVTKIGRWESWLRNGNFVVKEYDHKNGLDFQELLFDDQDKPYDDLCWFDKGVALREEYDSKGTLLHRMAGNEAMRNFKAEKTEIIEGGLFGKAIHTVNKVLRNILG